MDSSAEELYDFVRTISQVQCDACGEIETILEEGNGDAHEYFFKKGWRERDGEVFCPSCAKTLKIK